MINILYYDGNDKTKQTIVKEILDTFPCTYQLLETKDLSQTIGYLMQLDGFLQTEETKQPCFYHDLMILHDLDDTTISTISNALQKAQVPVARKAMLTKHNQTWTLSALLQEIEEEHQYFLCYDQLKQLLLDVNTMEETAYTAASWKEYQTAFLQGYLLFQEQQPNKALLEKAIQNILHTKAILQASK